MVRVTTAVIIVSVLAYAFLIAFLLLFLDKYLDLRVVAYTADASRQATNLLHFILTSDCTGAVEEKLVLKLCKLNDFSESRNHENCTTSEYGYKFSVQDLDGNYYPIVNELVFNTNNKCYLSYQRIKGYAEMPVVLYGGWESCEGNYKPGIANLTLMKTPLSELAFWISQASMRIDKGYDEELQKSIRVGPEVSNISFTNDEVCMKVNGREQCRHFSRIDGINLKFCYNSTPQEETIKGVSLLDPTLVGKCTEDSLIVEMEKKCKVIKIYGNSTTKLVEVIVPGVKE